MWRTDYFSTTLVVILSLRSESEWESCLVRDLKICRRLPSIEYWIPGTEYYLIGVAWYEIALQPTACFCHTRI
jgi:hypothetical protein